MDINRTHTATTTARKRGRLSGLAMAVFVLIAAATGAGAYALATTDLADTLTAPVGQGEPLPPEGREALAASRGDAAAQAALEQASDTSANEPSVEGASGEEMDRRTRNAVEEASRGDAAAEGSVSGVGFSSSASGEVSGT